jgi:hypothetical protein
MAIFGHFWHKIPSPFIIITSEVIAISSEVIAISSENFRRKGHFFRILSLIKEK